MKKRLNFLKNPKFLRILIGITIIIIIAGFSYFQKTRDRIFIDNSIIQTPIVSISSANPGILNEIYVYEGEHIKKGDTLAIVGSQTLYANTDGQIISINNQIGSTFGNPGNTNPVMQMIDPMQMRVSGTLDENKGLNQIRIGQAASFTIDALPGKTFWGYVDEIAPTANQTQIAFSISSERPVQQFQIYVRFDATSYPEIKNGMSAKITVFTKTP